MLTIYEDGQSEMLLKALELGLVQFPDSQVIDLSIDFDHDVAVKWCDDQWPDSQILATVITWVVAHDLGPDHGTINMYHYSYRFFMPSPADAMLMKLYFIDDIFDLPVGATIAILPAK
jgi:hypothetical protein